MLDVTYNVSRILNYINNLLQFLYDKYLEDAQLATPQTPTQPMPFVCMSQCMIHLWGDKGFLPH